MHSRQLNSLRSDCIALICQLSSFSPRYRTQTQLFTQKHCSDPLFPLIKSYAVRNSGKMSELAEIAALRSVTTTAEVMTAQARVLAMISPESTYLIEYLRLSPMHSIRSDRTALIC